jgi:serine protease Do
MRLSGAPFFSSSAAWAVFLLASAPAIPAPRLSTDFSALIESQGPIVVNISTRSKAVAAKSPKDTQTGPVSPNAQSLGSGFILGADGYVLTCAHVVENAREILVRLSDRSEYHARLIGADRRSDVALLKIEAAKLPHATIGDPNKLRVGEWVVAIGSPFGFDSSATTGIVSAKGRSLPNEHYVPFLQTDVAINPGNSGGPLFNLKGEVVGINSQIFSESGGFVGLSFAIPIDIAKRIAEELKTNGVVRRGWLGINPQEVSRELAAAYGLGKPRGALIADTLPGGPASRSELKPGDIVLEYQGKAVEQANELAPRVGLTAPGTHAQLTVFRRDRGPQSITVTVGELKEEPNAPALSLREAGGDKLGLVLAELTAADRKKFDTDHGLVVQTVYAGLARESGLVPGDVIAEVDGKRCATVADFYRFLAHSSKYRPALLRVRRNGVSLFLALRHGTV